MLLTRFPVIHAKSLQRKLFGFDRAASRCAQQAACGMPRLSAQAATEQRTIPQHCLYGEWMLCHRATKLKK
jgi:hypothetical protein